MKIKGKSYRSVWMEEARLKLINQPLLPHKFEILELASYKQVAHAIKEMTVRGAPAIGATAAYGMALAVLKEDDIDEVAKVLRATRPTAQDLFYGIDAVYKVVKKLQKENASVPVIKEEALATAGKVADDYSNACEKIGEHGVGLIKEGMTISTHCNAGWLAAVDWGTALAPMYKAGRQGIDFTVFVDETRPRMQGSRLTAFELGQENIKHFVIADNATGLYMSRGEIDLVIVGSDRIAKNGDIANKIGTYSSAVVAYENNIPFYVAAPLATIDLDCLTGDSIPIEERASEEVSHTFGWDEGEKRIKKVLTAPTSSPVKNPAFDVTPAKYITGIITELGIMKASEIKDLKL